METTLALTTQLLSGVEAAAHLEELATLRIGIFREFPYLYDGRREDELAYLKSYAETADAFVIIVKDGAAVVGAATGMPLRHETAELIEPFTGTSYPVAEMYYVGELLFCPGYRNRGLGMSLVRMIEEQVRSLGGYRYLTCATVARPDDHPRRPADYIPINRFLDRNGFLPLPGVVTEFTWLETDGVRRSHPMNFWVRELPACRLLPYSGRGREEMNGKPDRAGIPAERLSGSVDWQVYLILCSDNLKTVTAARQPPAGRPGSRP